MSIGLTQGLVICRLHTIGSNLLNYGDKPYKPWFENNGKTNKYFVKMIIIEYNEMFFTVKIDESMTKRELNEFNPGDMVALDYKVVSRLYGSTYITNITGSIKKYVG
jgi:uncharacterized protein YfaT (DUF1175 family)